MPRKKNALATALAARFGKLRTTAKRGKGEICKAAASVRDGWKKKNENHEKMWNRVKYISKDTEKRVKIEKYEGISGSILPQTGL